MSFLLNKICLANAAWYEDVNICNMTTDFRLPRTEPPELCFITFKLLRPLDNNTTYSIRAPLGRLIENVRKE